MEGKVIEPIYMMGDEIYSGDTVNEMMTIPYQTKSITDLNIIINPQPEFEEAKKKQLDNGKDVYHICNVQYQSSNRAEHDIIYDYVRMNISDLVHSKLLLFISRYVQETGEIHVTSGDHSFAYSLHDIDVYASINKIFEFNNINFFDFDINRYAGVVESDYEYYSDPTNFVRKAMVDIPPVFDRIFSHIVTDIFDRWIHEEINYLIGSRSWRLDRIDTRYENNLHKLFTIIYNNKINELPNECIPENIEYDTVYTVCTAYMRELAVPVLDQIRLGLCQIMNNVINMRMSKVIPDGFAYSKYTPEQIVQRNPIVRELFNNHGDKILDAATKAVEG